MRQKNGWGDFSFLYKPLTIPAGWFHGLFNSPGFFFYFIFRSVLISPASPRLPPPPPSLGPSCDRHFPAGWKVFDSSPRSQIYDYYFFDLVAALENNLNKPEHLLAARWGVRRHPTRTKVVWTERLTFPSAEPPSSLSWGAETLQIFDLRYGWTSRGGRILKNQMI